MKIIADQEALSHWGILGMRWGVRRSPEELGRGSSKKSKPKSEDRQKTDDILKKSTSEMSNQELNDAINRIMKERQLKDLTAPQLNKAQRMLQKMPGVIGKAVFKGIFNYNIDSYSKKLKASGDPKKEQFAEILLNLKEEMWKKDKKDN